MAVIRKAQVETPVLAIDLDALEYNIKVVSDFLVDKKAKLRPHFKTHKSLMIAHMQVNAGAKGITCAKLGEAEVLVKGGIKDVLIANQIVEATKIDRLAGLAKIAKLTVCVDNELNVEALSEAAVVHNATIYVYIEIDVGMGRCGVNTKEEVLALATLISQSEGLVFEGFQAYAGQLSHNPQKDVRVKGVKDAVAKVTEAKDYLNQHSIEVNQISGAGTGTYNITGDNTVYTELQAGSYVFMDNDYNRLNLDLKQSLTILTTVIHKRGGVAVSDAGQKTCCIAAGSPNILGHESFKVALSEEHGTITDSNDELHYLEKIEYIPSHCCTTVNLHDNYYCFRGDVLEGISPIEGRGKIR
ncbi:MAG: DSD1 family PLP-dependent enzyme [Oscillospiraceae bacterium]|nr:DSD1 family PLP-dependent enzyme [Oscillospiraceae bacterium]